MTVMRHVTALFMIGLGLAGAFDATGQSPRTKIDALALDTMQVGRVTVRFAPTDRARAKQLAELSEAASAFVERHLGLAFEFRLAALGPKDWFSPYGGPGMPYGIPWCSTAEALVVVPASLREGALVSGPTEEADRRRVDFVALHEFGHLASKRYLHPASPQEELPIQWFEEFVATYFAYSFVATSDDQWARSARQDWSARVERYTPRQLTLDWGFMRTLPPDELAQTYAWYQYALNVRAAAVHSQHGVGFLQKLKTRLPLHDLDKWSSESLLEDLEQIAPGFREWAARFKTGAKRARSIQRPN